MKGYRVTLVESGEDYIIVFDCMADDAAHAIEQAENAYPDCKILGVLTLGPVSF